MSAPAFLGPGERVLWAGRRGQPLSPGGPPPGPSPLLWLPLLACVPLAVVPATRILALSIISVSVGLMLAFHWLGARPCIYVTNHRLIDRWFGITTSASWSTIVGHERERIVRRDKYGNVTEEFDGNTLRINLRGRGLVRIGPILACDEVVRFLDGVRTGDIDPTLLPGMDGGPPAFPLGTGCFLAMRCQGNGESYGALWLGPRRLARFTDELPLDLVGLLLTTAARAPSAEELESRVLTLTRHPSAGHSWIIEASQAEMRVDLTSFMVRLGDRIETMSLASPDLVRLREYMKQRL